MDPELYQHIEKLATEWSNLSMDNKLSYIGELIKLCDNAIRSLNEASGDPKQKCFLVNYVTIIRNGADDKISNSSAPAFNTRDEHISRTQRISEMTDNNKLKDVFDTVSNLPDDNDVYKLYFDGCDDLGAASIKAASGLKGIVADTVVGESFKNNAPNQIPHRGISV